MARYIPRLNKVCILSHEAAQQYRQTGDRPPCRQHQHISRSKARELWMAGHVSRSADKTIIWYKEFKAPRVSSSAGYICIQWKDGAPLRTTGLR